MFLLRKHGSVAVCPVLVIGQEKGKLAVLSRRHVSAQREDAVTLMLKI